MNFIKTLSLRAKLRFLVGFLTIIVGVASVLLILDFKYINVLASDIENREIPILNKAHRLKLSVVQVQQWLTDISATRARDGLNDGFEEAEANARQFRQLIDELVSLDSTNATTYQSMLPTFEEFYKVGKQMAQSYIDEGPAGGNRMMSQFDAVVEKISTQIDGFLQGAESRAGDSLTTQRLLSSGSLHTLWIGVVFVLAFVFLFYFIMARALADLPILVDEMQRVANGDLTSFVQIERQDEIGGLSSSLNSMRSSLYDIVSKIRATTAQLSSAAEELSIITSETNSNLQSQRSETEQVATAMNEMTATVHEVASNINLSANAATEANDETQKGSQVVSQTVTRIEELAREIDDASDTVQHLEQNSQQITSVLDVIKGVAEQTNLLALNAAIEAARAGEQGRGFAVVADEVRTLASRTQQSTEEINQMIDKLLADTRTAVEVMNASREHATQVVEQSGIANDSLASIAQAVSRIHDMSLQIASSSEEQSSVSEEINRNIVSINNMTEQTAEGAEQISTASQELAQLAADLDEVCSRFQLS